MNLKNIYYAIVGCFMHLIVTAFVFVCLHPLSAIAQDAVPAMPDSQSFVQALADKQWPLAVALGITILIWFVRYVVRDKIPVDVLKYVMFACTVLGASAARIIQASGEGHTWWTAAIQGLLEGASVGWASMGIWSVGAKQALPTPKRE